jgi:hypothetical protein
MKLTISKKKRIKAIIMASLGLSVCILTYKIHENYEEQIYVQKHSPLVRMPIVGRFKGLGTLKSPNEILVWHKGKRYTLPTSNPYFRKTAKDESIEVNFDPVLDIVVRPDENPRHSYPLLVVMFLMGLLILGNALYDFRSISALQKKGLE